MNTEIIPHRRFDRIAFWAVVVITMMFGLLLYPVLIRAREQRNRAICMNNLKQIRLAMMLYSNTSREEYPCDSSRSTLGSYALMTNDYQSSFKTWVCPSDLGVVIGSPSKPFTSRNVSYAYGGFGFNDIKEGVQPDTPVITDRTSGNIRSDTPWSNNTWTHRSDGGNVAFADGHVEFIKLMKVPMYNGKNP